MRNQNQNVEIIHFHVIQLSFTVNCCNCINNYFVESYEWDNNIIFTESCKWDKKINALKVPNERNNYFDKSCEGDFNVVNPIKFI
jgi:hypothetical protein